MDRKSGESEWALKRNASRVSDPLIREEAQRLVRGPFTRGIAGQ